MRCFRNDFPVQKLLNNIPDGVNNILFFGVGNSNPHTTMKRLFPTAKFLAYDSDSEKIVLHHKNPRITDTDKSLYTDILPHAKFDLVMSIATLHENPSLITKQMCSLLNSGGYVGIIDYDMKSFSKTDFLARWGHFESERLELKKLGDDMCYTLHTSFGLEDCLNIMNSENLKTKYIVGGVPAWLPAGRETFHYVYIGQKVY